MTQELAQESIVASHIRSVGILGATSFLGQSLVRLLLDQGVEVRASYRDAQNVPLDWQLAAGLTCVEFDVKNAATLAAFDACDVIVWLAHRRQGLMGDREVGLNLEPFQTACDRMSTSACSRFILVSSGGAVYGEPEDLPVSEEHRRCPRSPYGWAKLRMEDALWAWGAQSGKATAVLRPGNIYGPETSTGRVKGLINTLIRCMQTRTRFTLVDQGRAVRDYIHVHDVSHALLRAVASEQPKIVWDVGTGVGHTSSAVIRLVHDNLQLPCPPLIHQLARETDVTRNILCNDRILNEAGWRHGITLEYGIASIVQEFDTYLCRATG